MRLRPHRNVLLLFGSYNHRFHLGIARYAGAHRWHLCADATVYGLLPHGWRGDGILTTLALNDELWAFIRRARRPTVDLMLQRPEIALPRVAGDNAGIGRIAADHFLERGFRHFAWFSSHFTNIERLRLDGFTARLQAQGFTCHRLIRPPTPGRPGHDTWREQRAWLGRQLRTLPKPLALLSAHDYDAAFVMDVCMGHGLQLPEEVAILGVNNSELVCDCLPLGLSSVNHDMERIGYEGAALLDRLMDGAAPPAEPILIPPRGITLRQSTDLLAVHQPHLRKALAFLRTHFARSIGTAEIAAASGLSRRALERLFREQLHRTVHEELLRWRVQQARDLLLHTTLTAGAIAQATGFCHPPHFTNVFRRLEGLPPKRYRLTYAVPGGPPAPAPWG